MLIRQSSPWHVLLLKWVGRQFVPSDNQNHEKLFSWFNAEWRRKFLDASKNLVLKFWTAISPKLFESDKRFIQRSKEEHQGFQINFWTAGLGARWRGPIAQKVLWAKSSTGVWLRRTGSGLCSKTLHAWCPWLQLTLFQNMLGPLWPNLVPNIIKWPHKKTGKSWFFLNFLVPFFWFWRHQVNNPWKCVHFYVVLSENLIQEVSLPYGGLVPLEVSRS